MTSSTLAVRTTSLVQVADYERGESFGPRRLADHEFVWMLRGSTTWTTEGMTRDSLDAGPRSHQLTVGTLALSRPGTVDSYQWDDTRSSTHAYVHFAVTDPGQLAEHGDWPETRSMLDSPILGGICGYLLELAGQQSPLARQRSDELVRLLLDLYVVGPLQQPGQALPSHLGEMVRHVRHSWAADGLRIVGVPELARAAGITVGHVHRVFRESYGCGPARALELVRLARAAISLQRSNATIAAVAQQAGFANPYHFSRRFALTYGSPPGAFRSLQPPVDALEPVRRHALLPVAHAVLNYSVDTGALVG